MKNIGVYCPCRLNIGKEWVHWSCSDINFNFQHVVSWRKFPMQCMDSHILSQLTRASGQTKSSLSLRRLLLHNVSKTTAYFYCVNLDDEYVDIPLCYTSSVVNLSI